MVKVMAFRKDVLMEIGNTNTKMTSEKARLIDGIYGTLKIEYIGK